MQLHSMIVDDFLSDFDAARIWADGAKFEDITNPVDGVMYPTICKDIPEQLRDEVHRNLCMILSTNQLRMNHLFARLSCKGVPVPHQAHNDVSMGMCSFMLYLNRPEDVKRYPHAGTDLVAHNLFEMEYGAANDEELEVWKLDANDREAWFLRSRCPMKSNRAFIFDARLMHRASPIGGFGNDQRDGRLVLTGFFDLE